MNVISQAALSRYDHRPHYRKFTDRFELLHGLELSGASAWHATERAARAGRCEYEQNRKQIQQTEIGHVDEPCIKREGEQAVSPTNNAAENALREPVVLRKIIGTLRDDQGMFVHETIMFCWRHGASRDAIPTKNFSESSTVMK